MRPLIAAAAILIAIPSLGGARMRDLDDPTIVAIFDMANTNDAETGALAVQRGQSKEARDFGAMLMRDHGSVRQMGRDLARKLGVTPTPPPEGPFSLKHKA